MANTAGTENPGTGDAPPSEHAPAPPGTGVRAFIPYLVAGVLFVGLGVLDPRFMLTWVEGIGFLLAVACGIPAAWRRLRR